MDKQKLLLLLEEEMEKNIILPLQPASLVFGEGNTNTKILFIGEAPGQKEDELQRPFVGRSGQLLTRILKEAGILRESVYITNIVKRRPPENRDPSPKEIAAYAPYLTRQIEILHPRVIVPLGRFSMNYFLPDAIISKDQGKLSRVGKYYVYPIYHPAAALRSTLMLNAFRKSIQQLPMIVERCKTHAVRK